MSWDKMITDPGRLFDGLVSGVSRFFKERGFAKALVGLSGGIDSAVVLVAAAEALGSDNVSAVLMPSKFTASTSVTDAVKLAQNLHVTYCTIHIGEVVNVFEKTLEPLFEGMPRDVTEENLQARVRGTMLMAISNKFGSLVLNTSNKSETYVGYGTLYGDMCGALAVLGSLYKQQVYAVAHYINQHMRAPSGEPIIPSRILDRPPSAELRFDQTDQDSLPPYEQLDRILYQLIDEGKSEKDVAAAEDAELVAQIAQMISRSAYKREQMPPILTL